MVGTLVLVTTTSSLGDSPSLMTYVICTHVPLSPILSSQDHSNSPHLTQKENLNIANQCTLYDPTILGSSYSSFPSWYFFRHIAQFTGHWEDLLCYALCTFALPVPLSGMLFPQMAIWLIFFSHLHVIASFLGTLFEIHPHPVISLFNVLLVFIALITIC